MGEGDVISSRKKQSAWYGSVALAWRVRERLSLKVQFDGHTAIYDSDLKEIGDGSVQLGLGGALSLSKNIQLDVIVSEDIHVGSSPDIVINVGLSWRPADH